MYDIIIIGSGPAGLAAAIYGMRAGLDILVLEQNPMGGGQIINTSEVDNYPGMPAVGGFALGKAMTDHAKASGAPFVTETVKAIRNENNIKYVETDKMTYESKTIIYAAGASHKSLGVPGEERLKGMGVSYCATCDGAFYRGRTVAVIGGGDTALTEALFLSNMCKEVLLIHRRDSFRGAGSLIQRVRRTENITCHMESIVEEICGEKQVEHIVVLHDNERTTYDIAGIFVAVGITPHTKLLQGMVEMNQTGYVIAAEDCRTNAEGIFVAGDVRKKPLQQVVTAVADGANAVASVQEYLSGH